MRTPCLPLELIRELLEAIYIPRCTIGVLAYFPDTGENDGDTPVHDIGDIPRNAWGRTIIQFQADPASSPVSMGVLVFVSDNGDFIDVEHFVIGGDPRDFPREFLDAFRGAMTVAIRHCGDRGA